jgi:hypothetical protein
MIVRRLCVHVRKVNRNIDRELDKKNIDKQTAQANRLKQLDTKKREREKDRERNKVKEMDG